MNVHKKDRKKKFFRYSLRPILLLEVIIAFALVALCALPLIYPHVVILKSEKSFIATAQLDHFVNLLYANRLQKLYKEEIPWSDIESEKVMPIDDVIMHEVKYGSALPFDGTYRFVYDRDKTSEKTGKGVYIYKLLFEFVRKGEQKKPLKFSYDVVIERRLR